jgi:hypothetical protein
MRAGVESIPRHGPRSYSAMTPALCRELSTTACDGGFTNSLQAFPDGVRLLLSHSSTIYERSAAR